MTLPPAGKCTHVRKVQALEQRAGRRAVDGVGQQLQRLHRLEVDRLDDMIAQLPSQHREVLQYKRSSSRVGTTTDCGKARTMRPRPSFHTSRTLRGATIILCACSTNARSAAALARTRYRDDRSLSWNTAVIVNVIAHPLTTPVSLGGHCSVSLESVSARPGRARRHQGQHIAAADELRSMMVTKGSYQFVGGDLLEAVESPGVVEVCDPAHRA